MIPREETQSFQFGVRRNHRKMHRGYGDVTMLRMLEINPHNVTNISVTNTHSHITRTLLFAEEKSIKNRDVNSCNDQFVCIPHIFSLSRSAAVRLFANPSQRQSRIYISICTHIYILSTHIPFFTHITNKDEKEKCDGLGADVKR